MKAITTTMYVCGSLMVAAAIMGAVDYTSARHKGTLDKLYKEEKPAALPKATVKEIDVEDYSRGEINRPEETTKVATPKRIIANNAIAKVSKPVVKKKRKITYRDFSRKAIIEMPRAVDTAMRLK